MFYTKGKEGFAPMKYKQSLFSTKSRNFTGFTLIELMVVLVIMAVLAILVVGGYSEGRPRLAVERTTIGFIGDINRTKEKAKSSVEEIGGEIIGGGYGIMLEEESRSYFLYVQQEHLPENITEEVQIETLAKIKSVSPNNAGILLIFFDDTGGASFNGGVGPAEVVFSAKDDESIARTVTINNQGVAEITYINE